jgi:hypothetical protein
MESTYGASTSSLKFDPSINTTALYSQCRSEQNSYYAHLTTVGYGRNPYPNSTRIQTPILRFSSQSISMQQSFSSSSSSDSVA